MDDDFDNCDTSSLRELGIENYPYPEMPGDAGVKLSRTQERQSLQNLNNRLAGYIDKVRHETNCHTLLTKAVLVHLAVSKINN